MRFGCEREREGEGEGEREGERERVREMGGRQEWRQLDQYVFRRATGPVILLGVAALSGALTHPRDHAPWSRDRSLVD